MEGTKELETRKEWKNEGRTNVSWKEKNRWKKRKVR